MSAFGSVGLAPPELYNCDISMGTIDGFAINNGIFTNCTIHLGTINKVGIYGGTYNECHIKIDTIGSSATIDIANASSTVFNLTRIECSSITNLNNTSGKLNILNGSVFHTS